MHRAGVLRAHEVTAFLTLALDEEGFAFVYDTVVTRGACSAFMFDEVVT